MEAIDIVYFTYILAKINVAALVICGIKAVVGFHWPWERCACCGKKYRDHKK
jgi:hypothetical protein